MKSKSIVIRSHGGPEVLELFEADVPDPAGRSANPAACDRA